MESGGEIYRVQQTIEHIGRAYGAPDIHAYVVTNAIFVSLEKSEGGSVNEMRYVRTRSVHLSRVMAVNALSRRIAGGAVSLEQAQKELEDVRSLSASAVWLQVFACGVGTACFAYLFGGTAWDAFCGLWGGGSCCSRLFCFWERTEPVSSFPIRFVCGAGGNGKRAHDADDAFGGSYMQFG